MDSGACNLSATDRNGKAATDCFKGGILGRDGRIRTGDPRLLEADTRDEFFLVVLPGF